MPVLNKPTLSIIIVTYNNESLIKETLSSIEKSYPKETTSGVYEILVVDNASTDATVAEITSYKKNSSIRFLSLLASKTNDGFSKANNKGVVKAKGEYLLFLNPDTIMRPHTLAVLLDFLKTHPDTGAVTCKLELPNGGIDEASHRGFPTPWNGFTHFSGLEKLFPKSHLFAGYIQGWKDLDTIHTVDAIVGAFMMMPRKVGEKVGWWDEDYFFYGEDLDLCYRIKKAGYNIYYVPTVSIIHIGGVSSGIKKHSQNITSADNKTRKNVQHHRFEAMRIFYTKHHMPNNHPLINWLVMKGISLLKERKMRSL